MSRLRLEAIAITEAANRYTMPHCCCCNDWLQLYIWYMTWQKKSKLNLFFGGCIVTAAQKRCATILLLLPSCSIQQWTHMVKVITAAKGGGCCCLGSSTTTTSTWTKAQQRRWSRWRDSSLPPTELPDGLGIIWPNLVNAGSTIHYTKNVYVK